MTAPERIEIAFADWTTFGESVFVVCPECRERFRLDHEIADDGTVTPSLDCPIASCDFHEFVRLVGWTNPLAIL